MRFAMILLSLPALALAEPRLSLHIELPAPKLDLDSLFERAVCAAGFTIDGGRLAFTHHGKPLVIIAGRARLTPLIDLSFGGVTALIRFAY
jgi:hypothetical protein